MNTAPTLRHRQVEVDGASVHLAECGPETGIPILCLHGWPGSWASFEGLMLSMGTDFHMMAIDLSQQYLTAAILHRKSGPVRLRPRSNTS